MVNHLQSAKAIIHASPLKKIWEKIGIKHHVGFSLPLSALHSDRSCGVGEYLDLLPMIDFAKEIGFDIIQLLPLNDSGDDPSPYNALSSIALHPLFLSLHALPFVDTDKELLKQMEDLRCLNQTKHVQYDNVLQRKKIFFERYYDLFGDKITQQRDFQAFVHNNLWVHKYALYKTLKESMTEESWKGWPEKLKNPTPDTIKDLLSIHQNSIKFYTFLQFLCFSQMKKVKDYASKKKIFIKGDIPILISADSADVWYDRELFSLDYIVGHPPDVFNEEGQLWGFPSYRWDEIEKTNFSWWKTRLSVAENFYHMYRLDHVAGFFRLWLIPYGKKPIEGFWSPRIRKEAISLGFHNLKRLISFSQMLPVAEDLGIIPHQVFDCLHSLAIPGTRVLRWTRTRGIAGAFIPFEDYFPINMSCISTHDSEPLAQWWNEFPLEAKEFAKFRGYEYQTPLSVPQRTLLLKEALHLPTLLHINLLQEYLALIPSMVSSDPKEERINIPGYILPTNWVYRFKPSIEKILSSQPLKTALSELI